MEVLNECSAFLSNYEVLDILQNIKSSNKPKGQNQLATITYQTIRYLEETPCKRQTPDKIKAFLTDLAPFKLTKCEKLTLLNQCPTKDVDIQLIIEDSEDRLTVEQVNELLEIIAKHLGEEKQEEDDEVEEGVD